MTEFGNYKNWKLEADEHNIIWMGLDKEGASANSLDDGILTELEQIIDWLDDNKPAGAVIYSLKKTGFVLGANIKQFEDLKSHEQAFQLMRRVQTLFGSLENLSCPTVAMVDGFCLGGGLELALACNYIVGCDNSKTKFAFPEVKLGIIPGWGGTVRSVRRMGPTKAIPLMMTGRFLAAKQAKRQGLIDAVCAVRDLKRAAAWYIQNKPQLKKMGKKEGVFNSAWFRPLLAYQMKKQLKKHDKFSHYPAPLAIIDVWKKHGAFGEKSYIAEAEGISSCMITPTSRHLVDVFFLQEQLKGLAKKQKFEGQHVHVIGGGTMGGDIAAWCALRGMKVTLQDRQPEYLTKSFKRAAKLFKKKLRSTHLVTAAMDRLIPDCAGEGIKKADVIIEAIFENLEAKQDVFKQAEALAKPTAILATNTSSIPLDEINQGLKDPSRLVGIHFFNPVPKMQLVEVVKGKQTDENTMQQAMSFVHKIGKLPLPVSSHPGFLVNRALMPYLMEAMYIHEEGVPVEAIDEAALRFGMPMGPVRLADQVGLDVCLNVAENLVGQFGGTVPGRLRKMVDEGHLGVKTGSGFYSYNKAGKQLNSTHKASGAVPNDLADRLIMRMINECMACLREGVVAESDWLDAGMIFGTGFAPFRAGPMHYVREQGLSNIVAKLEELHRNHGERFAPDAGWKKAEDWFIKKPIGDLGNQAQETNKTKEDALV